MLGTVGPLGALGIGIAGVVNLFQRFKAPTEESFKHEYMDTARGKFRGKEREIRPKLKDQFQR